MIHLSKTSKLDGIKSWSLIARDTCPGSLGADGLLVPACAGCYAAGGNYRYPNVKAPREANREDWERDGWEDDMVAALEYEEYFRWFDSGDMYALRLANKILAVMRRTPNTKHWLPTRMHKFDKFAGVLSAMKALPNVSVRFSSDAVDGTFQPEHGSVIYDSTKSVPAGTSPCGAYKNEGKCSGCRACWDKSVAVIAYPAHGRVMLAQIKKAA